MRPEHKRAIEAITSVMDRLGPQASAEAVAAVLQAECDAVDMQAVIEVVVHVMEAMSEIEQTYVPSKALTSADVRTKATQRELDREQ